MMDHDDDNDGGNLSVVLKIHLQKFRQVLKKTVTVGIDETD